LSHGFTNVRGDIKPVTGEKQRVAFSSVIAAIFLTILQIVAGILTGSLGILADAAHSAMDLCAAAVTFFAVRASDKPADSDHTYGHGKIESFSALIETLLLFVTSGWIIYEAVERLFLGKLAEISGTVAGIATMVVVIVVDISRAKALNRVAREHGSHALEADALHFATDAWISFVVIGGLILSWLGGYFKIFALYYGDAVAAFFVSILVIVVSVKLGKKTIDVLLDKAPEGMVSSVLHEVNSVKGVMEANGVRVRSSGQHCFIDLKVGICRNESHRVVHTIVHEIRERLQRKIPNSDIVVSTYPVDMAGVADREVYHNVKKVVDRFPVCTNIHNIHVYEVTGEKFIAIHLEVRESMTLDESHRLSHEIGRSIQESVGGVKDVSVNFECVKQHHIVAEDITQRSMQLIEQIEGLINKDPEKLNCHDIKVYSEGDKKSIFLHCELYGNYATEKVELISKGISERIKDSIGNIERIHVHVEPMG